MGFPLTYRINPCEAKVPAKGTGTFLCLMPLSRQLPRGQIPINALLSTPVFPFPPSFICQKRLEKEKRSATHLKFHFSLYICPKNTSP